MGRFQIRSHICNLVYSSRLIFSIIIFSGLLSPAFGAFRYKPEKLVRTAKLKPITVSQKALKKMLKAKLPNLICEKKGYFRTCFFSSQQTCLIKSGKEVNSCFSNLISSRRSLSELQAEKFSQNIGECVGSRLEKSHLNVKLALPICHNIYGWL